jgi:hypothetical protein
MLELKLYKNNNQDSRFFGYNYARVDQKDTVSVDGLAKHMAEHNTPFSAGVIKGILTDAVSCIRELTLEGKAVKIDNLAIFTVHCEANAVQQLKDIELKFTALDEDGHALNPNAALKSLRMCAQATGDYTKAELNKYGKLAWTEKAQDQINAAKAPQP